MPKINHLLIEETSVSISPINNLSLAEVNDIAAKFNALGVDCELFDYSNDTLRSQTISPYDLRINVNKDLKHRIILDIMADYGWINDSLINKYEAHIKRAEVRLDEYLNVRDAITPAQVDMLEFIVEPDVEDIIARCGERKHAEFILKLGRYQVDDEGGYVNHQLCQIFPLPGDVAATKSNLHMLNNVYFARSAINKAFLAQGGFVPDVKQIRRAYLDFIACRLDEKFGPKEALTDESQRSDMLFDLYFIQDVSSTDRIYKNELIEKVNGLFPHLKPMPPWPITYKVIRPDHTRFFAANNSGHEKTNKQLDSGINDMMGSNYLTVR